MLNHFHLSRLSRCLHNSNKTRNKKVINDQFGINVSRCHRSSGADEFVPVDLSCKGLFLSKCAIALKNLLYSLINSQDTTVAS